MITAALVPPSNQPDNQAAQGRHEAAVGETELVADGAPPRRGGGDGLVGGEPVGHELAHPGLSIAAQGAHAAHDAQVRHGLGVAGDDAGQGAGGGPAVGVVAGQERGCRRVGFVEVLEGGEGLGYAEGCGRWSVRLLADEEGHGGGGVEGAVGVGEVFVLEEVDGVEGVGDLLVVEGYAEAGRGGGAELLNCLLEQLLALGLVLLRHLAELLQLGQDVAALRHHLDVLLEVAPAAARDLLGPGLALFDGVLDVALEVAEIARVDGLAGVVEELFGVALLQRVGILLNELLDLGVLVENGLRLLQSLLPRLVAELLDLLNLLLNELADLLESRKADTTRDDVFDLLPCLVNLLLGLGTVGLPHLLELIDVAAELLLELGVVVDDVRDGVTRKLGDLFCQVGDDIVGLGGCLEAEARLGEVLELLVGIVDEGISFVLVVLAHLLPVVKGRVDVGAAAGNPTDVRVGKLLDVVDGLVSRGRVGLQLLRGLGVLLFGVLQGAVDLGSRAAGGCEGVDGGEEGNTSNAACDTSTEVRCSGAA
ncbi:hypothetical protein BN1708_010009 [Verticillium longisporum]|uniref:Uncharacterized protein n=1 Tax=Verticillium longisporum TaxID=100787 RepID=A0A0G4KNM8_VERLO|nr:hypothetical protein BN1708_010009 [Verticillium longisporum]